MERKNLTETSPLAEVQSALGNVSAAYARRWRKKQGWRTYRQLEKARLDQILKDAKMVDRLDRFIRSLRK